MAKDATLPKGKQVEFEELEWTLSRSGESAVARFINDEGENSMFSVNIARYGDGKTVKPAVLAALFAGEHHKGKPIEGVTADGEAYTTQTYFPADAQKVLAKTKATALGNEAAPREAPKFVKLPPKVTI